MWPDDLRDRWRQLTSILPPEVAREMAARRRRVRGRCAICGQEFEGTIRRMYCSNTCAVRAYRRRKREAQG